MTRTGKTLLTIARGVRFALAVLDAILPDEALAAPRAPATPPEKIGPPPMPGQEATPADDEALIRRHFPRPPGS